MPRLSVILLSLDGGRSLKKVVRHLSALQGADQIEIVVGITEEEPLVLDQPRGFAGFRVVRAPVLDDIGKARAVAIRAASAPFVALAEDHSFPLEGWVQALLAPLEAGAPAVGPQILVANPGTSISWSDAILCYGDYLRPMRENAAVHLPWHNSAYNREVLLAFGDRLDFLMQADSLIQAAMADQGHRFVMTPHAATNHCNHSLLPPHWKGLYWGNRLYGATRATREKWTAVRRISYAAAWPAIILLRAWRAARICFALNDEQIRYRTLLPLLFAGAIVAAAGEVWGYLFGLGHNTLRRRSHYELNRAIYVIPSEVSLLKD
jgi:Glycosyl transferase family 2